jgi:hypothetical protein
MEVSGQLHAPVTLPPSTEPLIIIRWEAGWAPELGWTRWRREKFLHCSGWESNPSCPGHSLVTLTAELPPVHDNRLYSRRIREALAKHLQYNCPPLGCTFYEPCLFPVKYVTSSNGLANGHKIYVISYFKNQSMPSVVRHLLSSLLLCRLSELFSLS